MNTSDVSFVPKNPNDYFSNHPQDVGQSNINTTSPSFLDHYHFDVNLKLRIRLGQKYVTYPNLRIYKPSNFPDIWISYKKGIPILLGETNYDYLELKLEKEKIPLENLMIFFSVFFFPKISETTMSYTILGSPFLRAKFF